MFHEPEYNSKLSISRSLTIPPQKMISVGVILSSMFSHFGAIVSSLSDCGIVISGLKMTQTTWRDRQALLQISNKSDQASRDFISRIESEPIIVFSVHHENCIKKMLDLFKEIYPSTSTMSCLGFKSFGKSPHGLFVSSTYNSAENHSKLFFKEDFAFQLDSSLISMNTIYSNFVPHWSYLPSNIPKCMEIGWTSTRKVKAKPRDPLTPELVCVLIMSKFESFIDDMKVIGQVCDSISLPAKKGRKANDKYQDTSIVGLDLLMCSKDRIDAYQNTSRRYFDKIEQEVF